eukprot:TRINITY_DN6683_c0_g1_i1.p1 TRINITY_DN6683_c0_g1~~TRINITY_DN6683_c0_g1_i1.p1  ORF type:complete len:432 (-),score=73.09 TRINITY_DN6683_c0_g1_i1:69-1364(-)
MSISTEGCHYSTQPSDVRITILNFLSLREQFKIREVCKSWLFDVSHMKHYNFRKAPPQIVPRLLNYISPSSTETLILSKKKYIPAASYAGIGASLGNFSYLNTFIWLWPPPDSSQSLHVSNYREQNELICNEIFSALENLVSLKKLVTNAEISHFSGLSKLTNLSHLEIKPFKQIHLKPLKKLTYLRFITTGEKFDLSLSRLPKSVKEVHVGNSTIISEETSKERPLSILNLYSSKLGGDVLRLITPRIPHLTQLYLEIVNTDFGFLEPLQGTLQVLYTYLPVSMYNTEYWSHPDKSLINISSCPKLTHLKLRIPNASDDHFARLFYGCPELELLYFEANDTITNQSVTGIIQNMKELKELSLRNCRKLDEKSLSDLCQLPKLTHLDIRGTLSSNNQIQQYPRKLQCANRNRVFKSQNTWTIKEDNFLYDT